MASTFPGLTIADARDGLETGKFSAHELAGDYISAIESAQNLNAYITETPESALSAAKQSDQRIKDGTARPLEGIPLGIKDLFCTDGVQTTAASRILEGFTPPYESFVTQNLWDAGAVMLGKTNLDEFAMGSSNGTSYFGAVENPWHRNNDDSALVPGGSSAGLPPPLPPGYALQRRGPIPAAPSASQRLFVGWLG